MKLESLEPFHLSLTKHPSEMSKIEAKQQFDEFMLKVPVSIEYFKQILSQEGVDLNTSSDVMLTKASELIVSNAKHTKSRPSDHSGFMQYDEVSKDLSVPTRSACCYLGILFGDCLLRDVPRASWILLRNSKKNIYYNHPVISAPQALDHLEPISVAIIYVKRRLDRHHPHHDRLFEDLYSSWARILSGTYPSAI